MDSDREHPSGQVPLPGAGGSGPADPGAAPLPPYGSGIRHARRMSNWTAAALIVGTGAVTVALAHQALPAAAPTAGSASAATGSATTAGATGPQATHSVATTSGSGVTVTTTTRTVHGKTIVTRAQHAPAYHDN
ncbi:MAG: hypothetical protein ACLPUO_09275 [Streptosporangiaceae bacterium]